MASSVALVFLTTVAGTLLLWPGVFSTIERFEAGGAWKTGSNAPPNFLNCCTCDYHPKNVTLHVLNVLKAPKMNMQIEIYDTYKVYLLGVMEQAATKGQPDWRFSATYNNEQMGFYLDAYNSTYANYSADTSYWSILRGDMVPTTLGISYYIPENGETVTFNLTKG